MNRLSETLRTPPPPDPYPIRNRWSIVVAVGLLLFMIQLDAFTVSTVLPVITDDLKTTPALAQWAMNGFTLSAIALVMPVGAWLSRVGRRPALLLSVIGFAGLGILVAAAPGIEWLIAARVVQGLFAAVSFVLLPLVAAEAVAPALRGRAMGLVFMLGPIGGITGPVLAGLLAEEYGWRASFLLNLPVAAVVLLLASRMDRGASLRWPARADFAQAGYLLAAFTAVLVALTLAVEAHPAWLLLLALGVPALAAWLRTPSGAEVRELLRTRLIRGSLMALWAQTAVQSSLMMLVPFFLSRELDVSAAGLGLPTMAMAVSTALTSLSAGWLADKWGAGRTTALGLGVIVLGAAAVLPLDPAWTSPDLLWRIAIVGIGVGIFGGAQTALTLSATPPRLAATASGAISLSRQTAISIAPSLAVLAWGLAGYSLTGMRAVIAGAAVIGALGVLALLGMARPAKR